MSFGGRVMAGKLPVVGATVQLYAAGTAGNGVAAGYLLSGALTTDSTGAFTIQETYSCPISTSQVYLIASGGSVGSSASAANASISMLTVLGACSQIAAASQVVVNEVTTAASAWALSQFLSAGGQIGASATNATGLANAFLIAASLASPATGVSPGSTFPGNAVSPAARINSMANLLNACTASATGNACSQLFAATPAGSTTPANTLDAALNLVRQPATNVAALYALSKTSTAFAPVLSGAPSDWTLFVTITGGGMSAPTGLGITSSGNVWVASFFSVGSSGSGTASLFTPVGAPVFPSGVTGNGLNDSYGLAVDPADNAWITNYDNSTITKVSEAGANLGVFGGGGLSHPVGLAFDTDGSVWAADNGDATITHLSASGVPLSGATGFTGNNEIQFPLAIAVDASHNVWVTNQSFTTVTRVSEDGTQTASVNCCNAPSGLAIDQRGYVWVANFSNDSVSEISGSLAVVSSGYTGGGLNRPQGIAVDGTGNVWVANFRGLGIAELAGSQASAPGTILSPSVGWGYDAPLLDTYALAIDASGNIWVSNAVFSGANPPGSSGSITQFIGLAAPVKTPLIGPARAP